MSLRLSSSWQGRSLLRDDLGPPELLLGDLLPRAGGPRPIVSSNASSAGSGTVGIVYVSIDIYFKTNDRLYPVCYGVGEGGREGAEQRLFLKRTAEQVHTLWRFQRLC